MIRYLLIISLSFTCLASYCQKKPFYETYDWEPSPKIHSISQSDQKYPAVVIVSYKTTEIVIGASQANAFTTEHIVQHINSDAGIEKFNKVALPIQNGGQLVSLKVRSIAPDGRVTEFQKANLKELQNVNGYNNFKIFAIEGLTVGGELEYFYTLRTNPQTFGREIFQKDVPVKSASFKLIFPKKLKWVFKSYNRLGSAREIIFDGTRSSYYIETAEVPALIEEQYSSYKSNLMRAEYQLVKDKSAGPSDWEPLAKLVLKQLYDQDGGKRVAGLIEKLPLATSNEQGKIIALENYIKANFTLKTGKDDSYEDLREIVSKHVANDRGFTKLFISCFNALGIRYQIAFANNRLEGNIDRNFASPYSISNVLFHFPQYKKFLAPEISYLRLGAAPVNASNGVFFDLNFSSAGELSIVNYYFANIVPLDYTQNTASVRAKVSFQNGLDAPQVDQENTYHGYFAFRNRGFLTQVRQDKEEEFLTTMTLSAIVNPTIAKRTVEGGDLSLSSDPDNELLIRTTYTSAALVEKAGDDYIFSIGKLIGRQSELYQEASRQTDIEMPAIMNYSHELRMIIPPNYQLKGIDKLSLSGVVTDNGNEVMKFESSGVVKDGELIVTVKEFYKVLSLSKAYYDQFRSVINASSDFNKVVVLLSPAVR